MLTSYNQLKINDGLLQVYVIVYLKTWKIEHIYRERDNKIEIYKHI